MTMQEKLQQTSMAGLNTLFNILVAKGFKPATVNNESWGTSRRNYLIDHILSVPESEQQSAVNHVSETFAVFLTRDRVIFGMPKKRATA